MVEIFFKSLKGTELRLLDTYKPGCWINIVDPDLVELEKIAAELKHRPPADCGDSRLFHYGFRA